MKRLIASAQELAVAMRAVAAALESCVEDSTEGTDVGDAKDQGDVAPAAAESSLTPDKFLGTVSRMYEECARYHVEAQASGLISAKLSLVGVDHVTKVTGADDQQDILDGLRDLIDFAMNAHAAGAA